MTIRLDLAPALMLGFVAACGGASNFLPAGADLASSSPADLAAGPGDLAGAPSLDLAGTMPDLAVVVPDLAMAPVDLATVLPDLAAPPADLVAARDVAGPAAARAQEINGGLFAQGARVRVAGLVATGTPLLDGITKMTMRCQYIAFAQDPQGQAPCGLKLYLEGPVCSAGDGGQCRCPYPPQSGTALDLITGLGDQITVTGDVSVYMGQHEIIVSDVQVTGGNKAVAAVLVADGTPFAPNGQGYVRYENMVIAIQPAQRFAIGALDQFGGFTGSNAHFAGDYRAFYGMAGKFPPANSSWRSITGVADPAFGGGIAPRQMSDFAP